MLFLLEDNEKKYLVKQKIGCGATCECYISQQFNNDNSEIYAIKIFPKKFYEFYSNEIALLTKLKNNKNFIKIYDYGQGFLTPISINDNNDNIDSINNINSNKEIIYYQVLEYADNGELKDYVNGTDSRIPENISAKIFNKIVNAVKYLHENNIAHCDLKPENILLDKYFNPKINDFGFSQEFDGKNNNYLLHKKCGTPIYSSPDIRLAFTKGYDGIKNDIFSLGVLLFVITIGKFPFEMATYSDDKYKFIIKGNFAKFWEFFQDVEISEEFKDLINSLINITPSKRLSCEEILKHPWLKKHSSLIDKINNNLSKDYNSIDNTFDREIFDEFNSRKK